MACEWYVYITWERKGKEKNEPCLTILKYTLCAASSSNFKMTTEGDAATYAEINDVSREAFEIVDNKCYSTVQTTSTGGIERGGNVRSSTRKSWLVSVIAAAILLILIFIVFMMSIIALSTTNSSDVAALQKELSMFQQNLSYLSEDEETIAGSVDHNSEELLELRQNYSQLLKIFHRNFEELYFEFQQLRSELGCTFLTTSCADLPSFCPSGYYLMRDRSSAPVYCNMALTCGNITGGWVRVAELNMTDTSQQCPDDLVERNETGIRQCRIGGNQCFSVYYSTADVSYLRVCGRITAYQVGSTNAFRDFYRGLATTIDSDYVTGVSLTHGTSPRQHIWTFAAALDKAGNIKSRSSHCPCQFDVRPF